MGDAKIKVMMAIIAGIVIFMLVDLWLNWS